MLVALAQMVVGVLLLVRKFVGYLSARLGEELVHERIAIESFQVLCGASCCMLRRRVRIRF